MGSVKPLLEHIYGLLFFLIALIQLRQTGVREVLLTHQLPDQVADFLLCEVSLLLEHNPGDGRLHKLPEHLAELQIVVQL